MDYQTAHRLEPLLLQFEDAWQAAPPSPPLEEYLRRADQILAETQTAAPLTDDEQTALLRELAMIDLEHRLRSGQTITADDYLQQHRCLQDRAVRLELLQFEVRIRTRLQRPAEIDELQHRHPDLPELHTATTSAPTEATIVPGTCIQDFVVQQHIGSGTFSDVYRASDTRLDRLVALKFLKPWMHSSANLKARMLREARAVASLQHPNVVPVFEIGQYEGRDFIASRFVQGQPLSTWCQQEQPPPRQSARLVAQLASALQAAHANGIVHRDVKPDNVIVDATDHQPMLLDFGLAHFSAAASELTCEGDIVGTPAYMSPEQASGIREVGPASDIYSLGVILYQMIAGQLPFAGRPSAVLQQTIHSEPEAPRRINPAIPRDLQTICLKAMARSPNDRYGSAAQLGDDLTRFLNNEPILARPTGLAERCRRTMVRYPVASGLAVLLLIGLAAAVGGVVQYANVVRERNRATSAEQETRQLLARDAFLSGQAAQRQGDTQLAVERYQEARQRGHADSVEIQVSLAECELANGRPDAATQILQQVTAAAERLTPPQEARWQLVRLQLALVQAWPLDVRPQAFADSIAAAYLTESDQQLLTGLKATNTPDALRAFERASELNSYNRVARRQAALLSFLLADFKRSREICETSAQLFSRHEEFQLLLAMNLAALQQQDAAFAVLNQTQISTDRRDEWSAFCRFISATCRRFDTGALRVFKNSDRQDSELNLEQLISVLVQIRRDYQRLATDNQWYLPPRISEAFGTFLVSSDSVLKSDSAPGFVSALTSVFSADRSAHSQAMKQLLIAHPEPTLKTTLARDALDRWGTTTENLIYVQGLFESSITGRSFVPGTATQARVGAFLAAMGLARVEKHEVEANQQRSRELLSLIDPEQIDEPEMLRILSLTPLQEKASWDVAAAFIDRWVKVSRERDDRRMLLDALWTQAVLHKNQQSWYRVLTDCDEILTTFAPEEWRSPVNPQGLKVAAVTELMRVVKVEGAEFHWDRVLLQALEKQQWGLAEAALAEMESLHNRADLDPPDRAGDRPQADAVANNVGERLADAATVAAYRRITQAMQQDEWALAEQQVRQLDEKTAALREPLIRLLAERDATTPPQ